MTALETAIRELSKQEVEALKDRVITLWTEHGMDTADIAAVIGFHDAWVDRVLNKHKARQISAGTSKERSA